jgi:hypothetical protein
MLKRLRRIPVFLAFVPFCLLLYALAWIPGLNVLLFKAKMSFWPIIIINGGLLGLVAEVLLRRLPKLWLLLPIAAFVGYGWLVWQDRQAVSELRQEIRLANADVKIPFQPAVQSMVFVTGKPNLSLIQNYGLTAVYASDANRSAGYISTRLMNRDVCDELLNQPPSPAGIHTKGFHEETEGFTKGPFEKRYCMVSMPEVPPAPSLMVSITPRNTAVGGMPVEYSDSTFEFSRTAEEKQRDEQAAFGTSAPIKQNPKYKLRDGFASPLGWFPMPVIAYNGMYGQNRPAFSFRRSSYIPLNTEAGQFTSGTVTMARLLGLKRLSPNVRRAGASADMRAKIIASEQATALDETARLDRVMENMQSDVGSAPFNSLQQRMDIILPRLDRIVNAVEVGLAEQRQGFVNAQQLFQLLKRVPEDKIAPYRARIDTYQLQDPTFFYQPPLTR